MIESSPAYKQAICGDARRVFAQNDKERPSGVLAGFFLIFCTWFLHGQIPVNSWCIGSVAPGYLKQLLGCSNVHISAITFVFCIYFHLIVALSFSMLFRYKYGIPNKYLI